jgi:hypothetical protein
MKLKTLVRLIAFAAILASAQSFALAQGAMVGYTATDLDNPGGGGNRIYRIDLNSPGQTVPVGLTNVPQELEGFFSIDGPTNSRLFGVAETPDGTSTGAESVLVDLTAAASNPTGLGVLVGPTGINFGTEAGSAWDHTTGIAYSAHADDLNIAQGVALFQIDTSSGSGTLRSITTDMYVDGLAVAGNGALYASDGRDQNSLYIYNFDAEQFELVGSFGVTLNQDTGLANYRGSDGLGTNLYLIAEGDGANVGTLWSVSTSGALTLIGELRLAGSGAEVPEDLEGFDIPWRPLASN